jgi:hypothetical protein
MKRTWIIASAVVALAIGVFAQEAQAPAPQAPPPQDVQDAKDVKYTGDSVARLSYVEGKAFVQRASDLGYEEGALNMPISEGDRIGTSEGRAEIHFGRGNYIRLDADTKVDILNLPKKADETARFRVWAGHIFLVVGTLKTEKAIELHTADSSFYVLDRGVYRVDVRENKDTEIQVYKGLIEVAGEEGSTLLKDSQRLEVSEGRFLTKPSSFIAVANDGFDRFNESRTAKTAREYAQARLPEELSDYEADLEEYGEWINLPPYGNVWVPGGVDDDWRPYYNGRWTWLPISGWTWWPYDPWGWATFHYGRWHWGVNIGWYWIPMNIWGPAWVNWWWDDWYFGWAPLSYWGYPGIVYGGAYYGHYYGSYYPYGSRALTVVRRDQLRDPHIAQNALRGDSLKSLSNRMSLTNRSLSLKPAGSKISVQKLDGDRVMIRNDNRGAGLVKDRGLGRAAGGASTATGPRTIRGPDSPGKASGTDKGTAAKPATVKSPTRGGEQKASPPKSSSSGPSKVKKKEDAPAAGTNAMTTYRSDPSVGGTASRVAAPRTAYGYPSSPSVKRPASYGDGGRARARTFSGPASRPSSGGTAMRPSTGRSSGSSSSSGRARVGSSSSGRSSGSSGVSRGSSSRSSGSASRGSSGGSRGSSGGGSVRKK